MTQPPQPSQPQPQGSITLNFQDLQKLLPTIAQYYVAFSWLLPILGLDIPPEADALLRSIASGKPLTPETIEQLKESTEALKPMVGEPVMTKQLAETAWYLHTKEGMGTREIAEQLTKDGSPVSHATVARWINWIDAEKRTSKVILAVRLIKYGAFIAVWVISLLIVHFFF